MTGVQTCALPIYWKKRELNKSGLLKNLGKATIWLMAMCKTDRQQPRLEVLFEIAKILDVDPKVLIKSEDKEI